MLKEKVFFRDGLPINIYAAKVEEYPIHFHDEMEIIYVLKGSVTLKNGYYTYTLNEGDIFILNDREIHSLYKIDDANSVVFFQISLEFFSTYFEDIKNSFFVTDMNDKDDESLEVLRMMILKILSEVTKQKKGYEGKVVEQTKDILTCLLDSFLYFSMEDGKFINDASNKGNKVLAERIRRITHYMYENYSRKLTLTEIAEKEHLNVYYLSHIIKEAAGMNFQELLNFIRVEESEKLLLGTSKKVSTIAAECGFSAVRYYVKYFKKWFALHPEEYRQAFTSKVRGDASAARFKEYDTDELQDIIKSKMPDAYLHFFDQKINHSRVISVDLGEFFKDGEAYTLTMELKSKKDKNKRESEEMTRLCKDIGSKVLAALQTK